MSSPATECIPSISDISGIGVRTAIYIQNLLSFVPAFIALSDKVVMPSEVESIKRPSTTILITAFAILLSAIVQARTLGLTNFHAIIILNLSWMNNTNTFIYFLLFLHSRIHPVKERPRHLPGSLRNKTIVMRTLIHCVREINEGNPFLVLMIGSGHLCVMAAVGIWLWSRPANFSISSPCSTSASTVLLGNSVPLSSKGLRTWSIFIYTIMLIPGANLLLPIFFLLLPYAALRLIIVPFRRLNDDPTRTASIHLIPTISGLVFLLLIDIIFIIDTELAIGRNSHLLQKGDAIWTFGQILALLLLLNTLRDLSELLSGYYVIFFERIFLVVSGSRIGVMIHLLFIGLTALCGFKLNINAKNDRGQTGLILAAGAGGLDVVELLTTYGADINVKDLRRETALTLAAKNGHFDVVRFLVENGAEVNAKGQAGDTALILTARSGDLDTSIFLIEHKADIDMRNQIGETALLAAAKMGHSSVVQLLIMHQANIHLRDCAGETALLSAAMVGQKNIVEFLFEKGADINAKNLAGQTALIVAARGGYFDVVTFLIDCKADDVSELRGETALVAARKNGHSEVVNVLTEYGANDVGEIYV